MRTEDVMREPQYQRQIDLRNGGLMAKLGLMINQVWHDDPKRMLFVLSRYKFAAKMLSGKKKVLEIGCGDAFASRIVAQDVGRLLAIDFDPIFIKDIQERMIKKYEFDCRQWDILEGQVSGGPFDAAYSLDVLEHIQKKDEDAYMRHVVGSLSKEGIFIVGTPSLESQVYASAGSKEGHVNCKDYQGLKELMGRYFENVFMFSMNDEVVHTGFSSMAHYLFAIGATRKP